MTDIDADPSIQRTAFLDTIDLISLLMLWDICRSANVLMDQISDWNGLRSELKSAGLPAHLLNRPTSNVNRGINIFLRLRERSQDYQYYTSRVCWSEAHHTLMENLGLEYLIRDGVPLSLREKRPQLVFRESLTHADHRQAADDIETFREVMRLDYGMKIVDVEDSAVNLDVTAADIWNGARAIWSHILIPVVDAYICASAILAKVDLFISGDPHRRDILNQLRDPADEWQDIDSVKESLCLAPDETPPRPLNSPAELP